MLYSQNKNYIKMSDISRKRTVALASFMVKRDMVNSKYDKVKYLNTEVYSEYMVNSFISNFNNTNSFMTIVPLEDVLPKILFDNLPMGFPLDSEYIAPLGYISTNNVPDDVLKALEGKVDSIMFANASLSFWSQRVFIDFSIYDLNRDLVWKDQFDGQSKYIIGDTSITPKTGYAVILEDVMNEQRKHENELYIIIRESISNSINNMAMKFPMIFDTNDYFQMRKTFSLTNNNYAKEADLIK